MERKNSLVSKDLRLKLGMGPATGRLNKHVEGQLDRLGLEGVFRDLLGRIMKNCEFRTEHRQNTRLSSAQRMHPEFVDVRMVPVQLFSKVKEVHESFAQRVCTELFSLSSEARQQQYRLLMQKSYANFMEALDQVLLHGEHPPQERQREAFKMRMSACLPWQALHTVEPMVDTWQFDHRYGQIIVVGCSTYPQPCIDEVARRAHQHRMNAEDVEMLEIIFWQLGIPPPPISSIVEVMERVEHEAQLRKEAERAAQQNLQGNGTAHHRITVPAAEPVAVPIQEGPIVEQEWRSPKIRETLSSKARERLESYGTLLNRKEDFPRHLRDALGQAEEIIDGEAVSRAFDLLRRADEPTNSHTKETQSRLLRQGTANLHAAFAVLRQRSFSTLQKKGKDDADAHMQFLCSVGDLLRASAGSGASGSLEQGIKATVDGLWATYIAASISSNSEGQQWEVPTSDRREAGATNILEQLIALEKHIREVGTTGPEAQQCESLLKSAATYIDLHRLPTFTHPTPSSIGLVRPDRHWPYLTHAYCELDGDMMLSSTITNVDPDASQSISTRVLQKEKDVTIKQQSINGAAHVPNSPLPLDAVYPPQTNELDTAAAITWRGRWLLKQAESAVQRTSSIAPMWRHLHRLDIPLSMITVRDGAATAQYFLFSQEDAVQLGLDARTPTPEERILLERSGVRMESDLCLVPVPPEPPVNEDTPKNWHKVVADFFTTTNVSVIPIAKADALLAIAGIRRDDGTGKHAKLIDARGRSRPAGTRLEREGQFVTKFLRETLLQVWHDEPPIGDLQALGEWIEKGGLYRDL